MPPASQEPTQTVSHGDPQDLGVAAGPGEAAAPPTPELDGTGQGAVGNYHLGDDEDDHRPQARRADGQCPEQQGGDQVRRLRRQHGRQQRFGNQEREQGC